MKSDQTGNDRLRDFLIQILQVTQTLVVTKVEEINGIKTFTLATPDGRSFNEGMKNCLLGIEPATPVVTTLKGSTFFNAVKCRNLD